MGQRIFFLSVFLSCFVSLASAANLGSTVDRYQLGEDETLTLTLTYDDASVSGQPSLAGLDSHFQIINSASSAQTKIINGTLSSSKQWRYTLLPKKTGKLLIPSFSLNGSYSEAMEIEVMDKTAMNSPQGPSQRGDLFVVASVNKKEAYVQEMITLTLRIYTSVQIAQPSLPELSLAGFMIEKIGESQFETRENQRNYYVLQYQFALFATQSGKTILPKQRYQISQIINNGPRSLFNIPGLDQTQARFISTEEIPLQIKAIPANNPADYWLPSDDLTLSDNWSGSQNLELGSSLTRSIEIKALGNLSANIPPLALSAVNGLKSYAEPPQLDNSRAGENLLATRRENIAIAALSPGTYTLPEMRLHWWSNKEKQFKVSVLPARQVTVQAPAQSGADTNRNTGAQAAPAADNRLTDPISNTVTAETGARPPWYQHVSLWMATSAFLLLAWLITLVLLLAKKPRAAIPPESSTPSPHSLQQAFKELKQACQANRANTTRNALLHWARLRWQDNTLRTLQDVKKHIQQKAFDSLADQLDNALYGNRYGNADAWNGQALLTFLQSLPADNLSPTGPATLPGLYS